jgi:UPF0042 nucleotide-binding protein
MYKVFLKSFGYRYGEPEADLIFCAMTLPDPYFYIDAQCKTGLDKEISDILLEQDKIQEFILNALIHIFEELKTKDELTVAVGCVGGKHRSVAITSELYKWIAEEGNDVTLTHIDIEKD